MSARPHRWVVRRSRAPTSPPPATEAATPYPGVMGARPSGRTMLGIAGHGFAPSNQGSKPAIKDGASNGCAHCGTRRTVDTWAQDPETGEQGLVSVAYGPDHEDEDEAEDY